MLLLLPYILAYILIVPLWLGKVLIQRPKERQIIRQTRTKLAKNPALKIAIAGSYGKTTMKDLLETVLREGKVVSATPGNLNTPIGISRFAANLVGDEEVLIFELGEYYPGDIETLCNLVQPDLGIITGVNEAHLSKFRSLEKTVTTIFELADYLQIHGEHSEGPGRGKLFVNGESELAAGQAGKYNTEVYTRSGVGEWKASGAKTDLEGTSFLLARGKDKIKIETPLLGLHQVGPLSAVAAVAEQLGLSLQQVETGFKQAKPFEHRLEPKRQGDSWLIDDAYNGNPDGAKAAIDFLASLKGHKRYYVTPGLIEMGHRTREVHEQIGKWLAEAGIETVVLIETSVLPHIEAGLKEAGFKGKLLSYPDMMTALVALPSLTLPGDVVLLQNDWPDNFS